jgi:Icc-related predicted phosphoesterase
LRERCKDVDLIVGCGDLPIWYMEFISSALDARCVYVHGNHDSFEIREEGKIKSQADGWTNLDMSVQTINGLTMAGLQGCVRYKPDAPYQYSQTEQTLRGGVLAARLAVRMLTAKRLDIMVTHAPPHGIHNGLDHAHAGFTVFNRLMDVFKPKLWLHGHQHTNYAPRDATETQVGPTRVINVHPFRVIEI